MEVGKPFKNLESYNNSMSKSIKDKLFFVEQLPVQEEMLFVDFGCADGTLLRELSNLWNKGSKFIGYDCSEAMINFAKKSIEDTEQDIFFTSEWSDVKSKLEAYRGKGYKKVLILSSVIHEIYSYATCEQDIVDFWNKISDFDYIVVRDMMASKSLDRKCKSLSKQLHITTSELSIRTEQIRDFEKLYGPTTNLKNLVHFLLKYRWVSNWDRELHENYFSIPLEDFLKKVQSYGFRLDYFEKFRVPFLDEQFYKDFHIVLMDTTHIKAIFTKENE